MAAPRTSSRDQRLQRLAFLQSMEERSPAAPQQDVIGQLTQLYQLQQAQQMDPLRQEALRAEIDALRSRASGEVKPTDILEYFSRTGAAIPEQLQHLLQTPQSQAYIAQQQAQKASEQAKDRRRKELEPLALTGDETAIAELTQMGYTPPPARAPKETEKPYGQRLLNLPAGIYNTATDFTDLLTESIGLGSAPRMLGPGDIYYDYIRQGRETPESMLVEKTGAQPNRVWETLKELISKTPSPIVTGFR